MQSYSRKILEVQRKNRCCVTPSHAQVAVKHRDMWSLFRIENEENNILITSLTQSLLRQLEE